MDTDTSMAGVVASLASEAQAMAAKRTTTQRGYGSKHQRIREKLRPTVDRGDAYCCAEVCLMASRWIQPGTPWHVGHTPDRTAYTGPEHEKCNTSEGAKRGNKQRTTPPARPRSRDW